MRSCFMDFINLKEISNEHGNRSPSWVLFRAARGKIREKITAFGNIYAVIEDLPANLLQYLYSNMLSY